MAFEDTYNVHMNSTHYRCHHPRLVEKAGGIEYYKEVKAKAVVEGARALWKRARFARARSYVKKIIKASGGAHPSEGRAQWARAHDIEARAII